MESGGATADIVEMHARSAGRNDLQGCYVLPKTRKLSPSRRSRPAVTVVRLYRDSPLLPLSGDRIDVRVPLPSGISRRDDQARDVAVVVVVADGEFERKSGSVALAEIAGQRFWGREPGTRIGIQTPFGPVPSLHAMALRVAIVSCPSTIALREILPVFSLSNTDGKDDGDDECHSATAILF